MVRPPRNSSANSSFRFLIPFLLILILISFGGCAGKDASRFAFVVVGDTRTEPYVTGGLKQAGEVKKVLGMRFRGSDILLSHDETGSGVIRAEITEKSGSRTTIHYRDGWPRLISTTKDGDMKVIMRESGRKWVYDRVVSTIQRDVSSYPGGSAFVVHSGDISLFGAQGKSLDENPYWQLFDAEYLSRLPAVNAGFPLPSRIIAAVGNHETWLDEPMEGMLTTMPWLRQFGLSKERRIYAVTFMNCRFIFLDSGDYGVSGEIWGNYPPFREQMDFLTDELKRARETGTDHVFIVYHKPSFIGVGHGPLPDDLNPHKYIRPFAKDLRIYVFNSHSHTTEHYLVDGIRYLVLGAGGASLAFEAAKHPSPQEELYWKGSERIEEYNFLRVEVDGPTTRGTIHRFRPGEPLHPFSTVTIFE
ncbi:MAG TPA: metallophosphoesterase [Dissulfurispiraceae bacterium]|nr:metallophosphoesterase [Dissulfurispiraceae bacterium]